MTRIFEKAFISVLQASHELETSEFFQVAFNTSKILARDVLNLATKEHRPVENKVGVNQGTQFLTQDFRFNLISEHTHYLLEH